MYTYIYIYICIIIYIYIYDNNNTHTNKHNNMIADNWGRHYHGAAAEAMKFDRLQTHVCPGTFWNINIG